MNWSNGVLHLAVIGGVLTLMVAVAACIGADPP